MTRLNDLWGNARRWRSGCHLVSGSLLRRSTSARGASICHPTAQKTRGGGPGLRPEKCTSGGGLTIPASARVIRKPATNQLGTRAIRIAVANQCLRGSERLRCTFRTHAAAWPHRAAARYAPAHPADQMSPAAAASQTRTPAGADLSDRRSLRMMSQRRIRANPRRSAPTSAVTRDSPKTASQAVPSAAPRSTLSAQRPTRRWNSRLTGVRQTPSDAAS